MALIKCPECGKEISDKSVSCINCGFPIQASKETIICPECGNTIEEGKKICGYCGYNIGFEEKKRPSKLVYVILGVLFTASIIFFIIAFLQTHNKRYTFYKHHYEECMDGYRETEISKYTSSYFGYLYDSISDGYLDMAKEDMTKIVFYIVKAIVFYFLSLSCFIVSLILVFNKVIPKKRGRKNGFNKMS